MEEKVLKEFDKTVLLKQIKTAEEVIKQCREQIVKLQDQINQQIGVYAFSKHLLDSYKLPDPEIK